MAKEVVTELAEVGVRVGIVMVMAMVVATVVVSTLAAADKSLIKGNPS